MPLNFIFQLGLYVLCFVLVWIGAGLAISAVSEMARTWKLPAFVISFFVLGLLTSLPEITISTLAIIDQDPSIMVGTLLGGVLVIFLGVIPLLGLLSGGLAIPHRLNQKQLVATLLVAIAPSLVLIDQILEQWEAILLVVVYLALLLMFSFRLSIWQKIKQSLVKKKNNNLQLLVKIVVGVGILIGASHQIINSTMYFAELWQVSPFIVSLLVVALGTNIPEISIVFRSILSGKKEIALADYLGSACANTLLMGGFALLYGRNVYLPNQFLQKFAYLVLGLILFFFFSRSKNRLSQSESAVLLLMYLGFVVFEILFISQVDKAF